VGRKNRNGSIVGLGVEFISAAVLIAVSPAITTVGVVPVAVVEAGMQDTPVIEKTIMSAQRRERTLGSDVHLGWWAVSMSADVACETKEGFIYALAYHSSFGF